MASANGTTTKTAASIVRTAGSHRPATSGNKNVATRASRKTAADQKSGVAGVFSQTHTGPYLGKKSL